MSVKYVEYEIVLKTESPFRVGRKEDPFTTIDQPIIMIGNRVVIPGTTLKGALREAIERYLIENYSDKPGMKPCLPATPQTVTPDEMELIHQGKYKGTGCHYPCVSRSHSNSRCKHAIIGGIEHWAQEEKDKGLHYICPVCYLLGAQGLVGFVTVPFLYADATLYELPALRIDRVTGTVATGTSGGTYRIYQIVPEGTEFRGVLRILLEDPIKGWKLGESRPLKGPTLGDIWLKENPEWRNPERIINELVIERLKSIRRLGGFKSHGAGYVKIEVKKLEAKSKQQ